MRYFCTFLWVLLSASSSLAQEPTEDFGMTGLRINTTGVFQVVVGVLPRTPAFAAGIKAEDFILAIGDTDTKDLPANEVAAAIRGEPGTPVTLTIRHHDTGVVVQVTLVRISFRAYQFANQ